MDQRRRPEGRLNKPRCSQPLRDLAQYRGVVDRGRHLPLLTVGDLAHGPAQNLPRSRFRQPLHHQRGLEARDRADAVAHELHRLGPVFLHARLQH